MSITVFSSAPKALVRSIAMAAVLGSLTIGGEAAASINISASSTAAFTSNINRFTSNDWLNGVWRREAGISVPSSAAAREAFKPGVQVKFADGQVRKISKVFVVGSNLSVYFEGGLLDGNKVGAPRTISTVTVSNTAPGTTAPGTTAPSEPTPPPVESSFSASMNDFTNEDWERGIYRKSAGFSIPASAANKAAFKVNTSVKLADGQVRKIVALYDVGQHLSVMLDGAKLSAASVGHPKKISVASATGSAPTPAPQPQPDLKPSEPVETSYSASMNDFTNEDWERGIYRKSAGFSIPNSATNKAAFKVGSSVRLADGQVRKVVALYDVGQQLSVMLDGGKLSASSVGYPAKITALSSGNGTAPSNPTPDPAPNPSPSKPGSGSGIPLVGVNFASGVFDPGRIPGIYNQGYTYADESYYKRHSELGFKQIRLGFLWERIQPQLGTPLNAAELSRIKTSLDLAHKYGMKVILDMHNYYRYYNKVINSPEVPRSAFTETWRKIAVEVHKHPALWGYGLMNEPYNTGNNLWPQTALEASKAIRKVDPDTWIMVAGDRYSSALFWESVNTQLISDPWMRDPKNNLVFEAHQYWDHDYSGSYRNRNETFAPMRGVDLVKPWVEWLKKHKLRGYLGEHGIPDFAPSGVVATDNMLAYLAENCIPSSYWAAGPRWGEDSMSLDVESGKHRPQLAMLQKHAATKKTCSTIGPLH